MKIKVNSKTFWQDISHRVDFERHLERDSPESRVYGYLNDIPVYIDNSIPEGEITYDTSK